MNSQLKEDPHFLPHPQMAQLLTGSIIARQKSVPKLLNWLSQICLSVVYPGWTRWSKVFDQANALMLRKQLSLWWGSRGLLWSQLLPQRGTASAGAQGGFDHAQGANLSPQMCRGLFKSGAEQTEPDFWKAHLKASHTVSYRIVNLSAAGKGKG